MYGTSDKVANVYELAGEKIEEVLLPLVEASSPEEMRAICDALLGYSVALYTALLSTSAVRSENLSVAESKKLITNMVLFRIEKDLEVVFNKFGETSGN